MTTARKEAKRRYKLAHPERHRMSRQREAAHRRERERNPFTYRLQTLDLSRLPNNTELTPLTPERHPTCALCGTRVDRLISVPSFRVTGFNAKNGYSSSKS